MSNFADVKGQQSVKRALEIAAAAEDGRKKKAAGAGFRLESDAAAGNLGMVPSSSTE